MRFLLGRELNLKPLDEIFGGWQLRNEDGRFNTQPIENVIAFIFLIYMLFICHGSRIFKSYKIFVIIKRSVYISFCCSLAIELCQVDYSGAL